MDSPPATSSSATTNARSSTPSNAPLAGELDPQGALETLAFQEILHAAWNLQRFRRIEAEVSLGAVEDFTDPASTAVLDRLTRYQARAQRAWHKAIQELRTLQTNRALRARKLTGEQAAEALDLACQMMDYESRTALRNASREPNAAGPQNQPVLLSLPR